MTAPTGFAPTGARTMPYTVASKWLTTATPGVIEGKAGTIVPKIKVDRKAFTNIRTRLGEALRYRPMQESIVARLARGSTVVRGWSNYFKIAHNFSQVAHRLDYDAFWITVKAICRKQDISTARCLRKYAIHNTIGGR